MRTRPFSILSILQLPILLSALAFSISAKPSLFICKHVMFHPDSIYSAELNNAIVDSASKYLSLVFRIDKSDLCDENILLLHHKRYYEGRFADLALDAHCNSDYFMCISASLNRRFGTEDRRFILPAPSPGGGGVVADITFKDTEPEYHFLLELYFTVYRVSDGKKIVWWQDQESSQDDRSECRDCMLRMISGISENTYRHLSSLSPLTIFTAASAGLLVGFEWYDLEMAGHPVAIGSDFGFVAKIIFHSVFGIYSSYSYHSINRGSFVSNEFYLGPCFGYKLYTRWPAISFLYPNGSLGLSGFWTERKGRDSLTAGPKPAVGAFAANLGVLLSLRPVSIGFEPNVRILLRPTGDGIFGLSVGIRLGYALDCKKIW